MSDVAKNAIYYFANQLARKMVIMGYDEFCSGKTQQRALLSYLVMPLVPPSAFRDHIKFSNRGIAQEIPMSLIKLGYKVDIINFNNTSWLPKRCYEIFIGHGGINLNRYHPICQNRQGVYAFLLGLYSINQLSTRQAFLQSVCGGVISYNQRDSLPIARSMLMKRQMNNLFGK